MEARDTRALYLSHGGGPLPLLGDAGHRDMVETLKSIAMKLARPSAIIVISAHWEERVPTISAGSNPSLIYDYYGFPEESYQIEYPCPGEPRLAERVRQVLADHGVDAALDNQRGFDHGLFVPLKIMYPQADIPCIQLSLVNNLDPALHIRIGAALAGIHHDGLLVIGSGFSFHNLKAFFAPANEESRRWNESFEHWLIDTCSNPAIDQAERIRRLENWAQAPGARYCHPREEHLLPLHVCCGFAGEECHEFFELNIMNKRASMYLW